MRRATFHRPRQIPLVNGWRQCQLSSRRHDPLPGHEHPSKFIPPDIAREGLTPRELELRAVLEQLTDMVNRQHERLQALEQEIAALRKAGRRAWPHALVRKNLIAPSTHDGTFERLVPLPER